MWTSVLNEKRILVAHHEPEVLKTLKREISSAAPESFVQTAATSEEARDLLVSWTYDLVILEAMDVQGLDLLMGFSVRPYRLPIVMLTSHASSREAFERSIQLGARAYLSKEKLGAAVPFLEDVLTYEYGPPWKRILRQVEGIFGEGWGPYWRKPDAAFREELERKISGEGYPSVGHVVD